MTPLIDMKFPAGTHTLTAVNPSRELKKTFKVTIKPGETTTMKIKLSD